MNTTTGIQIPENLFKAIDRVHKESTAIYESLDKEALHLISPNRDKKLDSSTKTKENKNLPKP